MNCKLCGTCILRTNLLGICSSNPACRRARRKPHDQAYDAKRKRPKKLKPKSAPVNRDHPWEIPDDGIMDETAIDIAFLGLRKVRLTPPEQRRVVRRMLRMDFGWKEMCDHLGIGARRMTAILDEMGYEAITDPAMTGAKYSQRKLITRKDRPRGPKMLGTDLLYPTRVNPGGR